MTGAGSGATVGAIGTGALRETVWAGIVVALGAGGGATRITGTGAGAGAANDGLAVSASDAVSSSMSFGNAIAPAPPRTANATVSARGNIDLMNLPLAADKSPRGLIGNGLGN